jgi:hypothetical protein
MCDTITIKKMIEILDDNKIIFEEPKLTFAIVKNDEEICEFLKYNILEEMKTLKKVNITLIMGQPKNCVKFAEFIPEECFYQYKLNVFFDKCKECERTGNIINKIHIPSETY